MGVAEDARLPDTWSTTENVAWAAEVPGRGWSSPIVVGDSIILTSVVSSEAEGAPRGGLYFGGELPPPENPHRFVIYSIDWNTGAIEWEREVANRVPENSRHMKNSFASETPVSDGERIYAYFGNVGLFCLDLKGEVVWSRSWDPVRTRFGWGSAASPVLHGDRIYIINDNDDQSYLLALDKGTGADIWRVDRDEASNWATPFIWENTARTEIVTPGTGKTRSYDLDGDQLWELTGMSSIAIPTPFTKFGLLYLASGYVGDLRRPVFAIRPGASGDISLAAGETSNDSIAWFLPQAGPYNPSPLIYGDVYYTLFDRGIITTHDARTGESVYYGRERIASATGFTASPWAYNGKIFALSEDGDTYVIQAGPEFEILRVNSLDEFTMATPAIARGSLIIRTLTKLYRIQTGN
jgi:outer membrane protein assembly factor BamB